MNDDTLYAAIWETARGYLESEMETEALTNEIWELLVEDSKGLAAQRSYDRTAGFFMGTMWGR